MTDTELAKALLHTCIDKSRADSYNDWIRIGMCLKHINVNLFDDWIKFSKYSDKFENEEECAKKWATFNIDESSLTMGTLRMLSKEDNHNEYMKLTRGGLNSLILDSIDKTHTSLAEVIKYLFGDEYVCTNILKNEWFYFNGNNWKLTPSACKLRQKLSTEVFKLYENKSKEFNRLYMESHKDEQLNEKSKVFMEIALKLRNVKGKDMVNRECCELFYDETFLSKLDEQHHLIGFNNGVYDLNRMIFRKGQAQDYLSMSVGYDYDQYDNVEIQDKLKVFMRSMQANEGMYQYLLDVSSYMLDGNKHLEYIWFLTGIGRNSKGVFTTLLTKTLGDYAYCPKVEIFMDEKSSSGPSSEVAKMKGKRCIIASEPTDKDGVNFKVSQLKNWRGNDVIQCRQLYKEAIEFMPQFGIMIQMNDMPSLDKVDHAFGMTLKVIRFPFTFCFNPVRSHEKMIDTTLKELFLNNIAYRQQFMRILLDNYGKNKGRRELPDPIEVKEATQDYLDDNNQVGIWILEKFDITNDTNDKIKMSELYHLYTLDIKSRCSIKMFSKAMTYNGYIAKKIKTGLIYVGFKMKEGGSFFDSD